MTEEVTGVLVIGGGLAGSSAAMFLASQGVPTVLVERHPASSEHPRAIGYTPRTMELYRSVGLSDRIPPTPKGVGVRRVRVDSLAGQWHEEQFWSPVEHTAPKREYSPCGGAGLAQDRLEPLLRERASELGADLRMSTRLCGYEQDEQGVSAELSGPDGARYRIRADYLIAADGHDSPIREELGIARTGRGWLRTSNSVLFRAELERYLESGFCQFVIDQPEFDGFLTTYGDGRWVFFHEYPNADPVALVRRAVGEAGLPVEVITTGQFEISALVAERYRQGRVFLVGDAAHMLPPNRGGYSANTGIEDTHNLAWKLAAVRSGQSGPALLDTYEAERRPVAMRCHEQLFARMDGHDPHGGVPDTPIIEDEAIYFGQLYRSSAVLGAGPELPPAQLPDQWQGQPGTRAPHYWLPDGRSSLDLLGDGWVLFAARADWTSVDSVLGIPLESYVVDAECAALYGIADGGATLIRPDGYIAWRSPVACDDPVRVLTEAFATVASARLDSAR